MPVGPAIEWRVVQRPVLAPIFPLVLPDKALGHVLAALVASAEVVAPPAGGAQGGDDIAGGGAHGGLLIS